MKITVLEYEGYKQGKVKVHSHKKVKGKYKINPKFELHKKLLESRQLYPIISQREYKIEVKE